MTRGGVDITWVEPTKGSDLFVRARTLGDQFASTVGHLPFAAWDDYAEAGRILAATDRTSAVDGLMGFVLYRLPRDEVAIAQLVVEPDYRDSGIARALIHELSDRYAHLRGIRLRCRQDFDVNRMWPRLGFVSRGERPGRRAAGSTLTEWWRDHGHADLMTWQGSKPQVVPVLIDSNVFIDLHPPAGSRCSPSVEILRDFEGDRLDILLSPETLNEIQRNPIVAERARLRAIANNYPRLVVKPSVLEDWERRIQSLVGKPLTRDQDVSDLRHVAYAVSAGVGVLVTRDRPARRRYERIAGYLGVQVTSVDELVPRIDVQENQPAYAPEALLGTGYQLTEMTAGMRAQVRHLLDHGGGERRVDFDHRLDLLARDRPKSSRLVLTDPNGHTVAAVGTNPRRGVLEVPLLRVEAQALEGTIAAQLVNLVRESAGNSDVNVIRVTDQHCGPTLGQALTDDGFVATDSGWIGITIRRALRTREAAEIVARSVRALGLNPPSDDLWPVLSEIPSAEQARAIEHKLRPLRLADAEIPTFIVPIKPKYSSDLFGYPSHLFERPHQLGISMEHVYYRAAIGNEQGPARILWYLSGEKFSEVFACSTLIEAVDAQPKTLYRRFRRLGVYAYADVAEAAEPTGMARALHVIDTHQFRRPISCRVLRSHYR